METDNFAKIDPEIEARILERIREVGCQYAGTHSFAPYLSPLPDGGVRLSHCTGETSAGRSAADQTIALIIGAGIGAHGKRLSTLPKFTMGNAGVFGSVDDLILSLNVLAKEQNQKIDLPVQATSRA